MGAHDTFLNFINAPGAHPNAIAWYWGLIRDVIRALLALFGVLLLVPPLIWFERRWLGFIQQRQGPNRVGPFGLLQPLADALKLLMKEDIIPSNVDKPLYIAAPAVMLIPALVTCGVIPWSASKAWGACAPNANIGILYILAFASLGVYGVVLAGWSSNNKYALLGGLRSSAQLISYELGMGLSIISVVLPTGFVGMQEFVGDQSSAWYIPHVAWLQEWGIGLSRWHVIQFFPMGALATLIYMISAVAETNRAPFDLPEAETELVAGYHTEYTSMKFAMFFMGEYANMVVVCGVAVTLFFGGYSGLIPFFTSVVPPIAHGLHSVGADWLTDIINSALGPINLLFKIVLGLYFFIWLRATMPRLRYDMLMEFGWKGLLPVALGNILCIATAMTFGYIAGLITWLAIATIAILIVGSQRPAKSIAEKTRRAERLQLYSEAQPYVVVAEATARGTSGGSSRPLLVGAEEIRPDELLPQRTREEEMTQ